MSITTKPSPNAPINEYETAYDRKARIQEVLLRNLNLVNALTQAKRDGTKVGSALRYATEDLEFELSVYQDVCVEFEIAQGSVYESEAFERINGRAPTTD